MNQSVAQNEVNSFEFHKSKTEVSLNIKLTSIDYSNFMIREVVDFTIELTDESSIVFGVKLSGNDKGNIFLYTEIPRDCNSDKNVISSLKQLMNQDKIKIIIMNSSGECNNYKITLLEKEKICISEYLGIDISEQKEPFLEDIFDMLPISHLSPCGLDNMWFICKVKNNIFDKISNIERTAFELSVCVESRRNLNMKLYCKDIYIGGFSILKQYITKEIVEDFTLILNQETVTFFINNESGRNETLISFSKELGFRNKLLIQHFFGINT